MKWLIPAKTFLVGEYLALAGESAMLLTTTPCFEVSLSEQPGLHGIHPDSPAGRLWTVRGPSDIGLQWHDPYHGSGGVGASSAQFLGAYLASKHFQQEEVEQPELLDAYFECAWNGEGLRPSGYDVLAQSMRGCVYINHQKGRVQSYPWPFKDIAFVLVHTGQKLATHQHLQAIALPLPSQMNSLIDVVEQARDAFEQADPRGIIDAVNFYHQHLQQLGLVAEHSMNHIARFTELPDVLAAKGCGAMGADVLLLLVAKNRRVALTHYLHENGYKILATSENLYL